MRQNIFAFANLFGKAEVKNLGLSEVKKIVNILQNEEGAVPNNLSTILRITTAVVPDMAYSAPAEIQRLSETYVEQKNKAEKIYTNNITKLDEKKAELLRQIEEVDIAKNIELGDKTRATNEIDRDNNALAYYAKFINIEVAPLIPEAPVVDATTPEAPAQE